MSIPDRVLLPEPLGPTTATIWPALSGGPPARARSPHGSSLRLRARSPSSLATTWSLRASPVACAFFFPLQRLFEETQHLLPAQAGPPPRPDGLPHGLLKGFAQVAATFSSGDFCNDGPPARPGTDEALALEVPVDPPRGDHTAGEVPGERPGGGGASSPASGGRPG